MKQILKIMLILAIILVVTLVGCSIDTEESQEDTAESEMSQWSDYYKEIFNEKCKDKPTSECCIAGLRDMAKNNYLLADENEECPEGFKENMLLCLGTLIWCEPIKTCAKEGEMISIMPTPTGESGMECCEGLTSGGDYTIVEGECSQLMDVAVCINCPNGECGLGEDKCNCPEDCE